MADCPSWTATLQPRAGARVDRRFRHCCRGAGRYDGIKNGYCVRE